MLDVTRKTWHKSADKVVKWNHYDEEQTHLDRNRTRIKHHSPVA